MGVYVYYNTDNRKGVLLMRRDRLGEEEEEEETTAAMASHIGLFNVVTSHHHNV